MLMEMEFTNGSKITSIPSESVIRGVSSEDIKLFSNTDSPTLLKLMEMGYDIFIECKGIHRSFAMTFEGRVVTSDSSKRFKGMGFHSVGNTIEDMAQKLLYIIELENE